MYINELYDKLPLLSAETYTYIGRDGNCHTESEPVLTEHILDVYLNDRLTMKLVCIPQYLTELVLGRLLTEGILEDASDVDSDENFDLLGNLISKERLQRIKESGLCR